MWALNVGASAPNPDTKDFSRKVLWNLKSFAKIKCVVGAKFFGLPFSERKVRKEVWNAVPTYYDNFKNAAMPRFLCMHYKLGLPPPNPDTKGFSRKVLWNLKSFQQNKVAFRWEVLWLTFLSRKVSAYFSYKKSRLSYCKTQKKMI